MTAPVGRPVIGISTYQETAVWRGWTRQASLVPTDFISAVERAGGASVLLPPTDPAVAARVVADVDGLLLVGGADIDPARYGARRHPHTGGVQPERDAWELALLTEALSADRPVLGVCRGMQLLNIVRGGSIRQHLPDLPDLDLHQPSRPTFVTNSVRLDPGLLPGSVLGGAVEAACYHHQAVASLGGDVRASGWSGDGLVEAITLPDRRFAVGVQWHPEVGRQQPLFQAFVSAAARSPSPARISSGQWRVTEYRGILAARDRAGRREVYLGADSLRFVDAILAARPRGRALDVGSGSGVTSCALARTCEEVVAIDVSAECVAATTLSATLNGLAGRVRARNVAVADLPTDPTYRWVTANLPYVPVPADLRYHRAGAGGPDGLRYLRQLLERLPELLDPTDGTLLLRCHLLGGPAGPILLPELGELARKTGYDVSVTAEGRIPVAVRSALTAHLAAGDNPGEDPEQLLLRTDAHLRELGQPWFFASHVVARTGGTGRVTFTDESPPAVLDRRLELTRPAGRILPRREALADLFQGRSRRLPDEIAEIATEQQLTAPLDRLDLLLAGLDRGETVREVTDRVFADLFAADRVNARVLYVMTEQLVNCLMTLDWARERQ